MGQLIDMKAAERRLIARKITEIEYEIALYRSTANMVTGLWKLPEMQRLFSTMDNDAIHRAVRDQIVAQGLVRRI